MRWVDGSPGFRFAWQNTRGILHTVNTSRFSLDSLQREIKHLVEGAFPDWKNNHIMILLFVENKSLIRGVHFSVYA